MEAKKIYKVEIKKECSKCGVCHSILPDIFLEDEVGNISLKEDMLLDNNIIQVYTAKRLCPSSAIVITERNIVTKEDMMIRIKEIINDKLSNIKFTEPTFSDIVFYSDEIELNLSFSAINSNYKFYSLEKAEEAGAKELQILFTQNGQLILKGAILDLMYKKINRFLDREDSNYYFYELEKQINNSISNINSLISTGWNITIPIDSLHIDLKKIKEYDILKNYANSSLLIPEIYGDFSDYVDVDADNDHKWRYEISQKSIEMFFKDVIYKSFDSYIEKDLLNQVNKYCKNYKEILLDNINNYKNSVYKLLPEIKTNKFQIQKKYFEELEKISYEFESKKQKVKEGTYVYFDTNYDSNYRFVFRSDAKKTGERRAERMEIEYKKSFEDYAKGLAKCYADEIIITINKYLSDLQSLCLEYGKDISDKTISVDLDNSNRIYINLGNVFVSQSTENTLLSYMQEICLDSINRVNSSILIFITVNDMEVYAGESIFGRSKFVTKYNYEIDDLNNINDKRIAEYIKLSDIVYQKKITNQIYKKIANKVLIEVKK